MRTVDVQNWKKKKPLITTYRTNLIKTVRKTGFLSESEERDLFPSIRTRECIHEKK